MLKRNKLLIVLIMLIVSTISISTIGFANINPGETFDEKMIQDMDKYWELRNQKFVAYDSYENTSEIEDNWIRSDNELIINGYITKAHGFYYDFNSKYVFEQNESLDDRTKDAMYHNKKDGYYYVSRKRYTNPYMYGYGVVLIVEKWDTKPTFDTDYSHMVGYTYYELHDDRVFQNGEPIFDAGKTTQNTGYKKEGYEYPVVLTDIDYSLNEQNEDIITAVGLGFKEDRADPDNTANYRRDGSIRVGYTVVSIYSMKIPEVKQGGKDYYNDYDVFISLVDGVATYDMPYNFEFQHDEDAPKKTMQHKFVKDQFLPRLTNDIHDESINWVLCQLSEDWLTNRVGHNWGKKPYMQLFQIDTSESNEPDLVSGYYQTFEFFNKQVKTIEDYYFYFAEGSPQSKRYEIYSEQLEISDGLSPFIIDKAFSHNRMNIMYLFEREHNMGWGNKVRFQEQRKNSSGTKYIRPIANNGIEMKVNSKFVKANAEYLGKDVIQNANNDEGYNQFYRYIVNRYPTMARYGAYNQYYDIPIDTIKMRKPEDMNRYDRFYRSFKDDLDSRNLN